MGATMGSVEPTFVDYLRVETAHAMANPETTTRAASVT